MYMEIVLDERSVGSETAAVNGYPSEDAEGEVQTLPAVIVDVFV